MAASSRNRAPRTGISSGLPQRSCATAPSSSGLSPGKKARKRQEEFASALSTLQDSLGTLKDIAVGRDLLDHLVATDAGRSVGFATGMTTANIEAKAPLAAAAQAHRELIEARPFWR